MADNTDFVIGLKACELKQGLDAKVVCNKWWCATSGGVQ